MRRSERRRRRGDAGESLIELLVSIAVIGITVPAIMGSVLLAVNASSQDRKQVQAQQLLTSWAETIARETTDATYTSCPALPYYTAAPFAPAAIPAGFTPSVTAIAYWNGTSAFDAVCGGDAGTRRVTLKVTVAAGLLPGFVASQSVVVRKPCTAC